MGNNCSELTVWLPRKKNITGTIWGVSEARHGSDLMKLRERAPGEGSSYIRQNHGFPYAISMLSLCCLIVCIRPLNSKLAVTRGSGTSRLFLGSKVRSWLCRRLHSSALECKGFGRFTAGGALSPSEVFTRSKRAWQSS